MSSPTAATSTAPTAAAGAATANRANAKAMNVQGMKAYKTKDYPGAAEKFRAAIAADPSFPLPHYNLACVAALTNDKATARAQLEWLAQSPDPQARRTLIKAGGDADLKSLADDPQAQKILQLSGVFPGYRAMLLDEAASDADGKRLEKSYDKRPDECEAAFTAARSVKGELAADRPGVETLVVSLADGATLFDSAGKVVARGEPLDPECSGGSQAALFHVSAGQVIADDEPEFVVHMASGGHGEGYMESIFVLKRRGDKLVSIVSEVVEGEEKGALSLETDGKILLRELGKKKLQARRWDAAKFALVEAPLPAPPGGAPPAPAPAPAAAESSGTVVGHVNGWTADSAFLSYTTTDEIDPDDEGGAARLTVRYNPVLDANTGKTEQYVLDLDGEPTKKEKKEYAKYPQLAAYKAWAKAHPTRCIAGRNSPDGKITTDIKVSGTAKKKHGKWKKDKFVYARDRANEDDLEEEFEGKITLTMTLNRDGKPFVTENLTVESYLDGELGGDVRLCWAPDNQRVVIIVNRERGMMRDPGEVVIFIEGTHKNAAAPAK